MSQDSETLFLFEFLVENIQLERLCQVSDRLALYVRLLDFPPLLIYQPRRGGDTDPTGQEETGKAGERVFNRGKSCVFKMNRDSLLAQLFNTPLHATVLDVAEDGPRLVGSSVTSLAKAGDRIKQGGVSDPSSRVETGLSAVYDLEGERVGTISWRFNLVCLGASVLPHITIKRRFKSTCLPGGGLCEEGNKSEKPERKDGRTGSRILLDEDKRDNSASGNEDLTLFCPPRLYYSNTERERVGEREGDFKFLNVHSEAFMYEGFSSSSEEKDDGPGPHQKVAFSSKEVEREARGMTPGVTPNILLEALKQLPLLNALVAELSLLTDSVHPRNCSTPMADPPKIQEGPAGNRSSSKPHRKKLVYGTTKTFNLRMKRVLPLGAKHRECSGLTQGEVKSRVVTGKTKREPAKSRGRGPGSRQSCGLSEDVEMALNPKAQRDELNRDSVKASPQRETRCVRLPRADSDERQSRSDRSESEFHDNEFKHPEKGISPHRGSEASVSGQEDGDYRDDFDSLESSDASLPGSPESSRTRTAKPVPVPVKSPSSPHRALRGMHVIRPQTPSDGSPSLPTVRSRKPTASGDRAERSSSAASSLSSQGERTESPWDRDSVRGFSDKSTSSSEAQEAEEMEDELGSLDFRQKYQHISELVASRLPGYTM